MPKWREETAAFARLWGTGLVRPGRAFDDLARKPAPWWGLAAVALRYSITTLTETVPLHHRGRVPFTRPYLPFLPTERYYAAQRFFLPVFGLGTWLAMSAVGHGALRAMARPAPFAQVLNIVGLGMLIPMPPLWLWDWSMIALDRFRLPEMAVSHTLAEGWEVGLFAIGFHQMLGVSSARALGLGLALGGQYIALATLVVR